MMCGSRRAPWRSPFREVEWGKNSTDGAISYPSGKSRPGLSPLHPQSSSPPPFTPSAKDARASAQTLDLSDLWPRGYRRRIKWIACMCSLFIADSNEK